MTYTEFNAIPYMSPAEAYAGLEALRTEAMKTNNSAPYYAYVAHIGTAFVAVLTAAGKPLPEGMNTYWKMYEKMGWKR